MTTLERIVAKFPFPALREGQKRALEVIASAYDRGKRFVLIEAPTGSGKSGIAKAITDAFGGFILTPQKLLTAQYVREFPDIAELRGRANYDCKEHGSDCETGGQLQAQEEPQVCLHCPYREAKERFCSEQTSTANFTYFLTERHFVGEIPSRPVLVVDEAHNIEDAILSHIHFDVSATKAMNLGIWLQNGLEGQEATRWVKETLVSAAEADAQATRDELVTCPTDREVRSRARTAGEFARRVKFFIESEDISDWLLWTDQAGFHAKPMSANRYAEQYLFGAGERLVVILSATILDFELFRRGLGIHKDYCELRLPCEFDVSNRQIIYAPAGSMAVGKKHETLPAVIEKIKKLLAWHPNDKGIIHCHTQELSKLLRKAFWNESRLIFYDNGNSQARDQALNKHCANHEPTVLVAQSMQEGLDLRDSLSRFQIILKVPFPFLGDEYIKRKKNLNRGWYDWQTALKLMQASGRSIRSGEDWAYTYVLDQDFAPFVKRAYAILPRWWKDAINWEPRKNLPKKPAGSVKNQTSIDAKETGRSQ
jgi:ATP-dependent DNA helicase DinG